MISQAESEQIIYRGHSPRDVPRYTIAQASRYLNLPPSTLRSWTRGRLYQSGTRRVRSKPLIHAAAQDLLSFSLLVEAHLMRALRVDQHVRMSMLRKAISVAEKKYGIHRLMLSPDLRTAPGELFVERYGQLIHLVPSDQMAMKLYWEAHLKRVQWDESGANKLFPFLPNFVSLQGFSAHSDADCVISIDPTVSFGRPVLVSKGIRTSAIVSRINANEDPDAVAQDYGIERYEIDAAIAYERAAA